ncbi:MAG: protein phosphatase CheZ [Devosiaceae bacterium]|nr:protein phosphatase CheZ [Devosiaceae bacterium MH13]
MANPAKTDATALCLDALARQQAEALVSCVNDRGQQRLDMGAALDVARAMTASLEETLRTAEHAFADAVRDAASDIQALRTQLSTLGVDEMRRDRLPEAGMELDAVVEETEKATDRIMEAAEAIMSADREDKDAFEALVDMQMIDIFEACTFQDITGQRIGKVVETLKRLETRFDRLLDALPIGAGEAEATEEEKARDQRREEQILNGPQLDGPEVGQDAIDALFD